MTELTKQQLSQLVQSFYTKVQHDPLLAPIFNEVAQVDWAQHLPLLTEFWSNVMLGGNGYRGGAYAKHMMLSQKAVITKAHFDRWLSLFTIEAKAMLPEPHASVIIERAHLIAKSLQFGMNIES